MSSCTFGGGTEWCARVESSPVTNYNIPTMVESWFEIRRHSESVFVHAASCKEMYMELVRIVQSQQLALADKISGKGKATSQRDGTRQLDKHELR